MRTTKNVTTARLAAHVTTNTARTVPIPAPARPTRRARTSRRSIKGTEPWPPSFLADEQDTYGTSIQSAFSYASEQEALDATGASCADAEQIRLRRLHGLEQSSQRDRKSTRLNSSHGSISY